MNKPLFWKLGLSAILALGLSACSSSSSSSADDDEDIGYSSTEKDSGKSSSSKKSASCKSVTANLAVPTNLEVVKNGDNKWVLIWDYSANDERPETGFVIESLDMSDSVPNWETVGTTNEAVVMYNLSGESNAGKYYRVSAMDDCGVSKATDMVEVTKTGANSTTSADLAVPTNLKLENIGDNMWQLSWSYTNNENRPEQGFKLQSLNLNDKSPKWSDDGTTNKGVHVIKIDGNKKGGLLFHVAAKDDKGVSEYSEEITIPRVVDSTSSSSDIDMDLAIPTSLKLDSIGANKYQLSWSYTDNKNRPENGFKIQSLNVTAEKPAWAVVDSTNKGVNRIIIDANKLGGYYLRVAAKDSKGTSTYSTEIQVPKADTTKVEGQEIKLAVPANLTLKELGNNEYLLSWSYTNNEKRPEQGFKLQSLDFNAAKPQWSDEGTTDKGVHVFKIDATKKGGLIFHVAAYDKNGTSEYSTEISIPRVDSTAASSSNMDLSTPTNLQLDSIGVNKYQLSWNYIDNKNRPENGFKIQKLDLTAKTPAWAVMDSTNKGVRRIIIDANKLGGYYLRVAAKDEKGTSTYSSEIQIPQADTTKIEGQEINLAVPTNLTLKELGNNEYLLSWNYTNNEKRPENGFKLQSLDFNAANPQWTDEGTTNKGVHVYKIDATKKGGHIFHVAAKDDKGVSEYSAEITIPSISDSVGSNISIDLAVPTNLRADSIGVNKYQLSWNYTDNKNRPENGFKLQILDLSAAKPTWNALDSTNKGVRLYNIDATKHGGKFVRVAAKDAKGISEYSYEIKIPAPDTTKVEGQELDLAIPVNLTLKSLGNNEYLLSWEYTNVAKRPAKGFVLQKLVIANGKSWENINATVKEDVLFFKLSAETEKYYVRVAAKDDKGTSQYSNVIEVPKKGEGKDLTTPPTNLTISRIAPSVWELNWKYENNVENVNRKFIIQSSKLENFKWTDIDTKIDGNVRNYYIQGRDKIETYYRMAVVNDGDTSAFTETIQLTPEIQYRDYMALNVPVPSQKIILGYTTAYETDKDTSTKEDITFISARATYTITDNFISKYIFESDYTDTVYYEARWFTSLEHYNYYKGSCEGKKHSDLCDSCYWIEAFPYEEPSISKRVDESDYGDAAQTKSVLSMCSAEYNYNSANHSKLFSASTDEAEWNTLMATEEAMSHCIEGHIRDICGYYVQIRIVWRDKNGETDWSEWTRPYNISDISGADKLCSPK